MYLCMYAMVTQPGAKQSQLTVKPPLHQCSHVWETIGVCFFCGASQRSFSTHTVRTSDKYHTHKCVFVCVSPGATPRRGKWQTSHAPHCFANGPPAGGCAARVSRSDCPLGDCPPWCVSRGACSAPGIPRCTPSSSCWPGYSIPRGRAVHKRRAFFYILFVEDRHPKGLGGSNGVKIKSRIAHLSAFWVNGRARNDFSP